MNMYWIVKRLIVSTVLLAQMHSSIGYFLDSFAKRCLNSIDGVLNFVLQGVVARGLVGMNL